MQVQGSQTDVMLELPVDDTAGGEHEDALMEMGFFVPRSADGFEAEEDDGTSSATVSVPLQPQCYHVPLLPPSSAAFRDSVLMGSLVIAFPIRWTSEISRSVQQAAAHRMSVL